MRQNILFYNNVLLSFLYIIVCFKPDKGRVSFVWKKRNHWFLRHNKKNLLQQQWKCVFLTKKILHNISFFLNNGRLHIRWRCRTNGTTTSKEHNPRQSRNLTRHSHSHSLTRHSHSLTRHSRAGGNPLFWSLVTSIIESHKSSQPGLFWKIKFNFHWRFHFFSCFSRVIAEIMDSCCSK